MASPVPATLVRLADVLSMIAIDPSSTSLDENPVDGVRLARTYEELQGAIAGEIVVLDPVLIPSVPTYRFDLAVGELGSGVAAVLGGSPSATARRTALARGVALGELLPDASFSALLLLVRDLVRGRQERDISVLESICRICDRTLLVSDLDALIAKTSALLRTSMDIRSTPTSDQSEAIRVTGAATQYLVDVGEPPVDTPFGRAARSYVARRIGELLQQQLDAGPSADLPPDDLVNEILLDEADHLGAVQRLRRMGFPIDGAHTAIRIGCHDHDDPTGPPMTTRLRLQVRNTALAAATADDGHWTCTGTSASIVLVSSQADPNGVLRPLDAARTVRRIVDAIDSLDARVHVGVGTRQVGVEGMRSTVKEAAVALRSAVDNRSHNDPHYFDRLGLGRALMQWAEIDWVKPVVHEALAPLLAQEPNRRRESLRTLRTYLDTGRSIGDTARRLHLHRNSVRYRVQRMEELLDINLDDPDERLFIELGCRLFLDDTERLPA